MKLKLTKTQVETCDSHDTFTAEHEPVLVKQDANTRDVHNETRETDVLLSGANYYAVVRGFVYTLRAFGIESEAREFAAHLYSSPSFAPEFGWTPQRKFARVSTATT